MRESKRIEKESYKEINLLFSEQHYNKPPLPTWKSRESILVYIWELPFQHCSQGDRPYRNLQVSFA